MPVAAHLYVGQGTSRRRADRAPPPGAGDTWQAWHWVQAPSLFSLQSCSPDDKKGDSCCSHTRDWVAQGCLLLPVAPPTSSAFLSHPLWAAFWKLSAHTARPHAHLQISGSEKGTGTSEKPGAKPQRLWTAPSPAPLPREALPRG